MSAVRVKRISEEQARRLAYTAELMVRLRSTSRVITELRARYGASDRTAKRWMQQVRQLRREEQVSIDVQSQRDDMRETFNMIVALALGKTVPIKNPDGSIVMEDITDSAGRQVRRAAMRAAPDLQRAIQALRELVHLDGLAQPAKAEIKIDADVTQMPDLRKLPPAAVRAAEDLLRSIAPGGDVAKLAGEWFTFAGETPPAAPSPTPEPAVEA
jgi:hypothetical protein